MKSLCLLFALFAFAIAGDSKLRTKEVPRVTVNAESIRKTLAEHRNQQQQRSTVPTAVSNGVTYTGTTLDLSLIPTCLGDLAFPGWSDPSNPTLGRCPGGLPEADQTERFVGIQFATQNRFAAATPVSPASGSTVDAGTWYGPTCPQPHNFATNEACAPCPLLAPLPHLQESEDCLNLNVYRPAGTNASSNLPVVAFIHGGAFGYGTGVGGPILPYDGKTFTDKGIIVVTFNYRLGWFGHLVTDELVNENANDVGVLSILDQTLALQWIQNNIAGFGGNPSQVTLWGESGGASSVLIHAIIPSHYPLFNQFIAQHHYLYTTTWDLDNVKAMGTEKATREFNALVAAGKCTVSQTQIQCFRSLSSADAVAHFAVPLEYPTRHVTPIPYHAAGLIKKSPYLSFRDGEVHQGRAMLGDNANEGDVFVGFDLFLRPVNPGAGLFPFGIQGAAAGYNSPYGHPAPPGDINFDAVANRIINQVMGITNPALVADIKAPYAAMNTSQPGYDGARRLWADAIFSCQNEHSLDILGFRGGDSHVFAYRWNKNPTFLPVFGPTHVLELPYAWNNFDNTFLAEIPLIIAGVPIPFGAWSANNDDKLVGAAMNQAWADFIKTGTPSNPAGGDVWVKYKSSGGVPARYRRINIDGAAGAVSWTIGTFPDGDVCTVFTEPGGLFQRAYGQ